MMMFPLISYIDSFVFHAKVITRRDFTVLIRVTTDSIENLTSIIVVILTNNLIPIQWKKKYVNKKKPIEAAKIIMMTRVSDDKENIDNSKTRLILPKREGKETSNLRGKLSETTGRAKFEAADKNVKREARDHQKIEHKYK